MRNRLITVSLGVLVSLAAGESTSAQPTLKAVRTSQPPKFDGNSDDPAWKQAPELKLDAVGRGGQAKGQRITVVLKAVYDADHVYFLLRWQDATEDVTHKSYVWNEQRNAYVVGPDREDNAAISFPIRGKFTADMLSGEDELWDVWHWKAARTGPAGYAMDRTHVFSTTKPEGKAKPYPAKNLKTVWIARPEDAGGSVTKEDKAPAEKQAASPKHYESVKPSGSAADIRTGHTFRNSWWTVEFGRKRNTGHADDVAFTVPGKLLMGIAVFDKSEHENHYTAGPITLELRSSK